MLEPLDLRSKNGGEIEVVEFGCGMGRKTLTLLQGILRSCKGDVRFVPIDVSSYYLKEVDAYYSARISSDRFSVLPYCG